MGIVTDVIAKAYLEAWLDSNNVLAAPAIQYTDDIYQQLVDIKKLSNQDYIRKRDFATTVAYNNVYTMPTDVDKMKQVSIKYTAPTYDAWVTGTAYALWDKVTDSGLAYICKVAHTAGATFAGDLSAKRTQLFEDYKPCTPATIDFDIPNDFNNIGIENPIYYYFNNTLYIYPRSKEPVVNGIVFDYIQSIATLTTSTLDADIKIEANLIQYWVTGVAMKFREHIRDYDGAAKLQINYNKWIQVCTDRWNKGRHYSPLSQKLPSSLARWMR